MTADYDFASLKAPLYQIWEDATGGDPERMDLFPSADCNTVYNALNPSAHFAQVGKMFSSMFRSDPVKRIPGPTVQNENTTSKDFLSRTFESVFGAMSMKIKLKIEDELRIRAAMHSVERKFQKGSDEVFAIYGNLFCECLQDWCEERAFSDEEKKQTQNAQWQNAQWGMLKWYEATAQFLKLAKTSEKIKFFFNKVFGPLTADAQTYVNERPESKRVELKPENLEVIEHPFQLRYPLLKCYYKIAHFIRVSNCKVPFGLLTRLFLSKKESMRKGDIEKLKKWIKSLNGNKVLTQKLFHNFLIQLQEHIKEYHLSKAARPAAMAEVQFELAKLGCHLLIQPDPEHYKWAQSLKPGDTVECNGKKIILGQELGRKIDEDDNNFYFEIEDDPKQVVWIGNSPLAISLQVEGARQATKRIRLTEVNEIDKEGKCALVKRLHIRLSDMKWSSTSSELTLEDKDLIAPLLEHFKFFLMENYTPKDFNLKYLGYTEEGMLVCTKITNLEPFSINSLEKTAFETTNPHIFKHLMKESGILEHAQAKFFKSIVKNSLESDKAAEEARYDSFMQEIEDPRITKQSIALAKEIRAIKQECMRAKLDQVNEKILKAYESSGSAGMLWPNFSEQIKNNTYV